MRADPAAQAFQPLSGYACHVCGHEALTEVPNFSSLPRVTSDCKPYSRGGQLAVCSHCGAVQKPASTEWRSDAARIYGSYDIYFQSRGVEQAVFDTACALPRLRSRVLLDKLHALRPLANHGKLIDVGCGKGTFLTAFQNFRPDWQLFGYELNSANQSILAEIPGFERLFVGSFATLPSAFDVITLIHALEHFEDPLEGLQDLVPKLADGGIIVVEVPNAHLSPFDFVIADHASHFTVSDLTLLARRSGLSPLVVADNWLTKELSFVAGPSSLIADDFKMPNPLAAKEAVYQKVCWLHAVLKHARAVAESASCFGIFGTSIASMWLYGEISEKVAFFVDEDPARVGMLHGRPVLTPDQIPTPATAYLALPHSIAVAVKSRTGRPGVDLVLPPSEPLPLATDAS